jgi:hypothetical protein
MLNRDQARLFQVRVFIDEFRTGMTAVEIQLAERDAFGSSVEKMMIAAATTR